MNHYGRGQRTMLVGSPEFPKIGKDILPQVRSRGALGRIFSLHQNLYLPTFRPSAERVEAHRRCCTVTGSQWFSALAFACYTLSLQEAEDEKRHHHQGREHTSIRGNFVSILMPNSLGNTAQSSARLHWAFFAAAKAQLAADGSLPRTLERRPPIAGSMELFGRRGRAGIRLSQPDIGVRLRDQSHLFVPADRQVHRTQVDGCHIIGTTSRQRVG